MGKTVFDFAMGPYPKESRIAAAKRNAVGGKRKRCTKGKNCSAACIAANMVCLVELPWVGPSLTKAVAQIQAMKGKGAPAAKPAAKVKAAAVAKVGPAGPAPKAAAAAAKTPTSAVKPAAKTPSKKPIDAIPSVEEYKKLSVPQLQAGIDSIKNSPKVKVNSPVPQKAIGNMEEAIKQLKAEEAAKAKPAPAPAAKPAAKPAKKAIDKVPTVETLVKEGYWALKSRLETLEEFPKPKSAVWKKQLENTKEALKQTNLHPNALGLTVDQYKTYNLKDLEKALPHHEAALSQAPNDLYKKKDIANIKQAIADLKAQSPGTATPAAPAATPAPKAAATPAKAAPAPAATPAAMTLTTPTVEQYKNLGLPDLENYLPKMESSPLANTPEGKKTIANIKQAIAELKAAPPKAAPAAQAATPTPKPAAKPATKLASQSSSLYSKWDTEQLVKFQDTLVKQKGNKAVIDEIQQVLDSRGYQKPTIPKVPYARPGSQDNRQGLNEGQFQTWNSFFKPFTIGSIEEYKQIGSASSWQHYAPGSLERKQNKLIKTVHLSSKPWKQIQSATKKDELPKVASIQKAADNLGMTRLKNGIKGIRRFTGVDYDEIRAAQRNRVPRGYGYDYMDDTLKQKMIKENKKKADDIEAVLGYMPKPQVPKMRGVAVDDSKLKDMIELAKNRGFTQEYAMNSWSTQSRTPQEFASAGVSKGYGNNRVIYRTLNKKGSSVQGISVHSLEDEIITPANAKYKFYDHHTVKGDGGHTYHIFDVVEY